MTTRFRPDRIRPASRNARPNRLSLFILAFCALLCMTDKDAFAVGTPAGSIIRNFATVTYTATGNTYTRNSNVNTLMVDDKVSFTLVSADTAYIAITSSDRAYMTYILANSSNATHDFTLNAAITGTPGFVPDVNPRFYADAAGTKPLPTDPNAGGLPFISNLAPDAAIAVYMFITAPVQLPDRQTINYVVTAEAYQPANLGVMNPPVKTSTQAAADAPINKSTNPTSRYVVLADAFGNGGDANRDGKYAVLAKDGNGNTIGFRAQSATVNVVKSVTVTDRQGNSLPLSGATLHYALAVTTTGSGKAFGMVITDPIPANTTYIAGTLKLNGTILSDTQDSDAGEVGGANPGIVTVKLGDLTSASPAQIITFDAKID
jgi:uncharacterized repeat protein (TIGR01451 family)